MILSYNDIQILKTLIVNELKVKYKRNVLGFFWSLLNPVLSISLISIVFSRIMGMSYKEFILFLFPGFLAWNLFSNSINSASNSLIFNEGMIKKIPINKLTFPLVSIGVSFIDSILGLMALMLISSLTMTGHFISIFAVPVGIILIMIFAAGFALISSILVVFWRDMSYLIIIMLQLTFYLTPVLYPKSRLADFEFIANFNPMSYYIELLRLPMYNGIMPSGNSYILCGSFSVISLCLGIYIFKKFQNTIVFRL